MREGNNGKSSIPGTYCEAQHTAGLRKRVLYLPLLTSLPPAGSLPSAWTKNTVGPSIKSTIKTKWREQNQKWNPQQVRESQDSGVCSKLLAFKRCRSFQGSGVILWSSRLQACVRTLMLRRLSCEWGGAERGRGLLRKEPVFPASQPRASDKVKQTECFTSWASKGVITSAAGY